MSTINLVELQRLTKSLEDARRAQAVADLWVKALNLQAAGVTVDVDIRLSARRGGESNYLQFKLTDLQSGDYGSAVPVERNRDLMRLMKVQASDHAIRCRGAVEGIEFHLRSLVNGSAT